MREIDKQYEVNNNELLDNGVYHDFNIEKEDSLQSDFRETLDGKNMKNDQLQKLEKMILLQEDKNAAVGADTSSQGITKGSTKETLKEEAPAEPIDEDIIEEMEQLGYKPALSRQYLCRNELNNASTTYYLLQSKKQSNLVDTTTQKKKD